ncbi:MAG: hypothetical protein EOP56_09705 [Sphingobacteriales bacterium]|nr:MAG: hypothetical protein EOP56_09705 [Sphingobacteriales bacterium]
MKAILASASLCCLTALPAISFAQSTEPKETKVQSPKFVIGLQSGISRNYGRDAFYQSHRYQPGKSGSGIGLYARYFISEHWALESGINYNMTDGVTIRGYGSDYTGRQWLIDQRRTEFSIEVPVQVQYHLLSKESKIRPYFGAGLVVNAHRDRVRTTSTESGFSKTDVYYDNYKSGQAFVTQGVTWQINKKWQLNQSVRYRFNGNTNGLDFKLGVGYTIK